jgi:RNA polymerase primary sigma factor
MNQEAPRVSSQEMRSYRREIAATPLLNSSEERDLAHRIAVGDAEARDHLIRANLRLVVYVAGEFLHRGLGFDDLVAEGNLGLIRASETFDPDLGVRFSTYASYWIKQSIRRHVIDRGRFVRLPNYVVTLLVKWKRASAELAGQLGREPSPGEVGRALGLSTSRLRIALEAIQANALGRHQEGMGGEKEDFPLEFFLADTQTANPEEVLVREEELSEILAGLDRLGDREATVLRLRYGLGSEEPLTLAAVGEQLGLTRERVRQLEQKALAVIAAGVRCGG